MDHDELCPSQRAAIDANERDGWRGSRSTREDKEPSSPAADAPRAEDRGNWHVEGGHTMLPPTKIDSGIFEGYRHAAITQPDPRPGVGISLLLIGPENWPGIKEAVERALDPSQSIYVDFDAPEYDGIRATAHLMSRVLAACARTE